jgi:MFS family permease
MSTSVSRLAPLTGLLFVGLIFAAFVSGGTSPSSDATAQHVVSWYAAHRNGQLASAFLIWYGVVFGFFFFAALRSYLSGRAAENGLVTLGFAGAIVFGASAALLAGITYSLADVPEKISPAAEQAMNVLSNDLFPIMLVGMGVALLVNGLAIVRSRALPVWLGWAGIVIGVVSLTPVGWFGLFGTLGWTLVVSVLIYARTAPAAAAAPSPA